MEKKKTLDLEIAILGGGFAGVYCGKAAKLKRASEDDAPPKPGKPFILETVTERRCHAMKQSIYR
jgi:hypothetical protein